MASIGNSALVLTANNQGLDAGLKKAKDNISGFITQIGSFSFFGTGPFGALVAGAKTAFDSIKHHVESTMSTIGQMNKFAKTLGMDSEQYQTLSAAAKLAGVDQESLQHGMRHLADVLNQAALGSRDAQKGFAALGFELSEVQAETDRAAKGIGSSSQGIARAGMSVQQLARMPLPSVLVEISRRFAGMPSPMARATAGISIFGKGWLELGGLLASGNFDKAVARVKELGIALPSVDASKISEANKAIKEMHLAFDTVANQLTVALAPSITKVATEITAHSGDIRAAFNLIGDAVTFSTSLVVKWGESLQNAMSNLDFDKVVEGLQRIDGELQSQTSGWQTFGKVMAVLWGAFVDGIFIAGSGITWLSRSLFGYYELDVALINRLIKLMAKLPSSLGGDTFASFENLLDPFDQATGKIGENLETVAAKMWEVGASGGNIKTMQALFDSTKNSVSEAEEEMNIFAQSMKNAFDFGPADEAASNLAGGVLELEATLQQSIDTWGMSSDQVARFKLSQAGATEAILEQVDALLEQKAALDDYKKQADAANKINDEFKDPFVKFQEKLTELDVLLQDGMISWQTYAAGVDKAFVDMAKAADVSATIKGPSLEKFGSKEAASTIIKYQFSGINESREDAMKRIASEQKQLTQTHVDLARQTLGAIRDKNVAIL